MTDHTTDPWERLRDRSQTADGRADARAGRFLTPDASERLYVATAAVLASVRQLVEVAEEIVAEKIDSFPTPETARSTAPEREPSSRFADIQFTNAGSSS